MKREVFLIGIVGGSASGKTCLAHAVVRHFAGQGSYVLPEDDYYVDAGNMDGFDPNVFNFDEPASKDHDLLDAHLRCLKGGQPVDAPRYDFTIHCRLAETVRRMPAPVIVVEGLHLLASRAIAGTLDLTVFVDADRDTRFRRRLARDVAERGRTPDFVRHQFETLVEPMHVAHVEPQRERADLVVENVGPADFDALARPVIARMGAR
jgi:uridine kinase